MSRTPFLFAILLRGEVNRVRPMDGIRSDVSDVSAVKVGIILEVDLTGFDF
jgi:hypothetical protein